MDDCPFCNVDAIKTRTLRNGENVRVILSNPRLMKGHLLVVPKRHIERPWELTDVELKEVFFHIHDLQKKLSTTFGTGCDVRQNYRPFVKQGKLKVDHLHYHLLPRTFQDELYERSMKFEADIFTDLLNDEANEVCEVLKSTAQ